MNIKRAKEEIQFAIRAYLEKDALGAYCIPAVRQRPILLMGPPGIGKTAIMEQIARECKVNLVAYTITHHTRQSAVGLPFIQQKEYGGTSYSVTEYTMSEIIASVYGKMEETGIREGILFIDEINCVSETLAPTMLQFLQCKTFGSHCIPEGWIIAAAGNPPEYNKSVREFDLVTLDRVRKIDVVEDYPVWKEYAHVQGIHGAVLAYLDAKKENFYRIETTIDGKSFVTARGWEDLSELLYASERLELPVDQDVVYQYLQHRNTAKDFANFLELYYKYNRDYQVDAMLHETPDEALALRLKLAPFDEKLSVAGLLLAKLSELFRAAYASDLFVTALFEELKAFKFVLFHDKNAEVAAEDLLGRVLAQKSAQLERDKKASQLNRMEEQCARRVVRTLESYGQLLKEERPAAAEEAFALVKARFETEVNARQNAVDEADASLTAAFRFLELAFGNSQEMVVFVTELTANFYAAQFLHEHPNDYYHRYNRGLLFSERRQEILKEIDDVQALLQNL